MAAMGQDSYHFDVLPFSRVRLFRTEWNESSTDNRQKTWDMTSAFAISTVDV